MTLSYWLENLIKLMQKEVAVFELDEDAGLLVLAEGFVDDLGTGYFISVEEKTRILMRNGSETYFFNEMKQNGS